MKHFYYFITITVIAICQFDTAIAAQADLASSNFSFSPQTISVGSHPDAVSFRLTNNGPEYLASPNTRVVADFYISRNTTFGDGDDIKIGDNGFDFTMFPSSYTDLGLSSSGLSYITIPSGASGDYYVFVRVQHSSPSTLTDQNPSNDCAMRTGTIHVSGANLIEEIAFINSLTIYPNPSTSEFVIEIEITKYENIEINLLNVIGQVIYKEELNNYVGEYKKTIDIGKQVTGIYTLQLLTKKGSINKKIMIQ